MKKAFLESKGYKNIKESDKISSYYECSKGDLNFFVETRNLECSNERHAEERVNRP